VHLHRHSFSLAIDAGKLHGPGFVRRARDPVCAPRPVRGGCKPLFRTWPLAKEIRSGIRLAAIAPRAANDAEPNLSSPILSFDLMTAKTFLPNSSTRLTAV